MIGQVLGVVALCAVFAGAAYVFLRWGCAPTQRVDYSRFVDHGPNRPVQCPRCSSFDVNLDDDVVTCGNCGLR